MKDRKGFTLVELLAVIVILAIIMIIAIPSVLGTMTSARKKTFYEYLHKVVQNAEKQFMEDTMMNRIHYSSDETVIYYNIETDLGTSVNGDFHGYVRIIVPHSHSYKDGTKAMYEVLIWNDSYAILDNVTSFGYFEPDTIITEKTCINDVYRTNYCQFTPIGTNPLQDVSVLKKQFNLTDEIVKSLSITDNAIQFYLQNEGECRYWSVQAIDASKLNEPGYEGFIIPNTRDKYQPGGVCYKP